VGLAIDRARRRQLRPRRRNRPFAETAAPAWWDGANVPAPATLDDDQVRLVRRRRFRGRVRPRHGWNEAIYDGLSEELDGRQRSVTLPPHVI